MTHLYEHGGQPLISRRAFTRRMMMHLLAAAGLVIVSLWLGMLGYHVVAHFSWIDSFLNAAMLLGGMGPIGDIANGGGKIFAGVYALYAGLVLIVSAAVLLTPVLHRVMHRIHLEGKT